jgi:ribosomal protein S5
VVVGSRKSNWWSRAVSRGCKQSQLGEVARVEFLVVVGDHGQAVGVDTAETRGAGLRGEEAKQYALAN